MKFLKKNWMILTAVAVAAVGVGVYGHHKLGWFGGTNPLPKEKATEPKSGASGKDSGGCSDAGNGYRCDGHWEKRSDGSCYCTGDLHSMVALKH